MGDTIDHNTAGIDKLKGKNTSQKEPELDIAQTNGNQVGTYQLHTIAQQEEKIEAITEPSWLQPILRRDNDFENTAKPRFESSNSLSCGIFKEVGTNKEWLGKSLTSNKEQSEAWAIKERIAADVYAYFGVKVPKIELSLQKMTNVAEFPGIEGKESIHVMSELIQGFKTYKEAFGNAFDIANPNPDQQIVFPNGESIPERGLGKILAVATLINDIDVIGANGGNIGYQIVSHPTEAKYAQTIKIDPGEAFAINDVSNPRKIRAAFTGTPKETELNFDNLPNGTKEEFLATVHKISETTEATLRGFFTREGAHHFVAYYKLTIDELTEFLMDRKVKLIQDYREYLDYAQRYQDELKITEIKRGAEERARSNEHQAYQEELYYYIDPYIIDKEHPTNQMPLKTAIDQYLDFERDNTAGVILIKGESGAGKSLALRFLELRLLEKRRDLKTSPMPIHIDLKKFTRDNVKGSFERVLKEKYFSEYDPNKAHLVILMDGYDEISGGCQSNLYDIQQLYRYSKNLRVIITCRTQYLTTGYQEWFKPAEGQLKELEIQQFNDDQIYAYLKKYSEELEKTGRERYSPKQYQERIEEYPALKDLIVNPFMLRLVAESLPRLDEYIQRKQAEIKMNHNGRGVENEEKKTGDSVVLNRYAIYECFMEHWFAKQQIRLMRSSGISENWQAIEVFRDFSRKVALILLTKQEVEIKIKEDQLWDVYFGNSDPDMIRARNGCPLRRQNDHQYSFIHKSFLEYFVTNGILDSIVNNKSRLHGTINLLPSLIAQDLGVLSFFRDAFVLDPELKDKCFRCINGSKALVRTAEEVYRNSITEINAANAITLLNVINYDFSGLDLSNISIPSANLSQGIFEQTNFANSNLTNVNFASSWLKDANFEGANLFGVNFGEWPYLQFEEPIHYISFSADGKTIAAAMGSSIIIFIRDIKTGKVTELKRIQEKSSKPVEYCRLNADGKQAIICSKGDAPYMWDITTEDCLLKLQTGFGYEATTFDFSSDGKQIVFSSEDNSLRIWNIVTGILTHEFRGHLDKITTCKFSPDGTQIVSASQDKTLRIWDVASGSFAQQITKTDITKKSLNLTGANIEDTIELSDTNVMLLHQRGACGFSEKQREHFIENLDDIIGNQRQDSAKLDLSRKLINDESAWGIGKHTSWVRLEHLNLSQNYIANKGATGIGSNSTWLKLKTLNLASNMIEDQGAIGLAKNSSWCNLEELDLRNNKIGDDGARALSTNAVWERLKNITLEHNNLSQVSDVMRSINEKYSKQFLDWKNDNQFEFKEMEDRQKMIQQMHKKFRNEVEQWKDERKESFRDILEKRNTLKLTGEDLSREGFLSTNDPGNLHLFWMPYIKSLTLARIKVSKETIISLDNNLSLIDLEELIMSENDISDAGTEAIGSSNNLKNLKKISLQGNKISSNGVIHLVKNSTMEDLEVLKLSENTIGDVGAKAIGESTKWKNLKELYLNDCSIRFEGIFSFETNFIFNNLQILDLSSNKIEANSVKVLAESGTWKNLEVLNLSNNKIDDEGGVAIGGNKTWKNLIELNLSNNLIGDKSAIWIGSNTSWKKIKKLNLSVNEIGEEGGVAIGGNQVWTDLEELNLSNNKIGNKTVSVMGTNISWKSLIHLLLEKNIIGEEGVSAMGESSTWSKLEKLDLSENRIGENGIAMIITNDCLKNLKVLLIDGSGIGEKGAQNLSRNTSWTNLQTLGLSFNQIGDKGAENLSKNTSWTHLHTLHLSSNEIGEKGAEHLSKSTSWNHLHILNLSTNKIGEKGAEHLSKNTSWSHLHTLNLSTNKIGEKGAEYLSKNSSWTHLRKLYLSTNEIGEKGAEHLSKTTSWTHLHTLDLSSNEIGEKGAEHLSKNTSWTHLHTLHLSKNKIGEKGAEHLSKNTSWTHLHTLHLSTNNIGKKGAEHLSKNTSWTHLHTFNLSSNQIGEIGTENLSKNTSWTYLHILDLSTNNIGEKGAGHLSKNTSWTHLHTLHLSWNNIGEKGAEHLSKNSSWNHLHTLDLSGNGIGERGAEHLSKITSWTHLHTLDLSSNQIGEIGAGHLSKNTSWTHLHTLHLSWNNIGGIGAEHLSKNASWTQLHTLHLSSNQICEIGAEHLSKNTSWTHLHTLNLSHNDIGEKAAENLSKSTSWTNLEF